MWEKLRGYTKQRIHASSKPKKTSSDKLHGIKRLVSTGKKLGKGRLGKEPFRDRNGRSVLFSKVLTACVLLRSMEKKSGLLRPKGRGRPLSEGGLIQRSGANSIIRRKTNVRSSEERKATQQFCRMN